MKKLGFGTMRLPMINDEVDIEQTKKMVDEFISKGFTYFDTAWMYCKGQSEPAIKKCLVDRYPRDKFTVTTKLPSFEIKSFEDREKVFNAQKEKTGLDYFDFYFLHAVSNQSIGTFDKWDCWNFIKSKKESGEIKHIGFSFHDSPELLEDILTKHPEIEYVQLQLNYLDWLSKGVRSKECYEVCVKHNKPVMVMEPIKGGTLINVKEEGKKLFMDAEPNLSMASWAIRFAASLDNVYVVLSGMSNIEQMLDNISYMENFKPLTQEENELCLKVADIISKDVAIPCTGCEYCMSVCPIKMQIPKLFSLYNADKRELKSMPWTTQATYYRSLMKDGPRIDECKNCGACEHICPQHLEIRKLLKDVEGYFENKM